MSKGKPKLHNTQAAVDSIRTSLETYTRNLATATDTLMKANPNSDGGYEITLTLAERDALLMFLQ